MIGTFLLPLSELRTDHPEVYEREIAKYKDRPGLPQTRIPLHDCLWNDVIHCSPIHPHLLYRAWCEAGKANLPEAKFYRIPIERVAGLPMVIMRGRSFMRIDSKSYAELDCVPHETLSWYTRLVREGRFGGHFVGIPHILVKGPIDVRDLDIINWKDMP